MTLAQERDLVDTGLGNTGLHERRPVVAVESMPAHTGNPARALPALLPQHARRAETRGRDAEARLKARNRTPCCSIESSSPGSSSA